MSTLIPKFILNNSNGLKDAPADNNEYVLKDGQWEDIDSLDLKYIPDAPADGQTYRRRNGSWVPADPKSNISTHPMTDHCIGVEMAYPGGGSGTWVNINKDGKYVRTSPTYFDNHPIWGNMRDELVDGQHMVRIPKFYFKNIKHRQIWISDTKIDESFKCHPAFMNNGVEQDCFWIGKYAGVNQSSKICSLPNKTPSVSVTINNLLTYCRNRNTGGVTGFNAVNIYMLSAIQMLFMIEYSTTNVQSEIADGYINGSAAVNVSNAANMAANYRGIIGLWGNTWEVLDGMRFNNGILEIWPVNGSGLSNYSTWVSTGISFPSYVETGSMWTPGTNCGYIEKMFTVTDESANYDFSSVFVPDPTTLKATYEEGTYSDFSFSLNFDSTTMNGVVYSGNYTYTTGGIHSHGLFYLSTFRTYTGSYPTIACRISKI